MGVLYGHDMAEGTFISFGHLFFHHEETLRYMKVWFDFLTLKLYN
jgi:hypothetical protein